MLGASGDGELNSQLLVKGAILLLILIVAMGSVTEGGALSNKYSKNGMIVYIPLFIFLYLLIVAGLTYSGLNPNKFELFFIPILILAVIVIGVSVTSFLEFGQIGNQDTVVNTTSESSIIITSQTQDTSIPTNGSSQPTTSLLQDIMRRNQGLFRTISFILGWGLLLVIVGIGAYLYLSRRRDIPVIDIVKSIEYSQPIFETNKSIIEYYIDASKKIDQLKGRAPDWFSPTFYADHVTESPGPPLSSYLDKLTELYELARFSHQEMTADDVAEAKELNFDITNIVQDMLSKLDKGDNND